MHNKTKNKTKYINKIKWQNLIILLFIASVIIPISLSKYTSTLSEKLTLNVRKPEYTVKFYPNRDILPDGYIEVGYLETDGSQYINLGNNYPISENTIIELGASFDGSWLYGYTEGDSERYGGTIHSQYTGTAYVEFEESLDYRNYIFNHSTGTIIDGITYSYSGTPSGSSGTNDIYLFRANGSTVFVEGKIYYFRQYENSELVYNLIPCYRESDNIKGMYDLVSDTFFTNSGTGEFESGYATQKFTYGTPQNLTTYNYAGEGYTFAGWNTNADGSGTSYSDGQEVNNLTAIDGDEINLYAQWSIKLNKPLDDAADSTIELNTDYGLIEVIWLSGDSNTFSQTANEPDLYTDLGTDKALTPVTWTYYEDGITINEKTVNWEIDSTAKSTWYNYSAEKGNDGKEDNTTSMWANAINTDGSYFVWIPRYAYRITYYEDASYTNVTGYYDGYGMWKASDGKKKYEIDEGIETVEYNEKKYIVHPAFMNDTAKLDSSGNALEDYARGGWDQDLTGIWVAKYEMSRTGADAEDGGSGYDTTFLSVPGVQSAGNIAIGNMYQIGKSYDSEKESHMIKNSEWGAVVYLTQSQYGRNGHEINVNNSNLTGNGGETTSATEDLETYEYNTILGAKSSSTGNIYGIYDLSGGKWEHVAVYDKLGKRVTYNNDVNKGTIIISDVTDASGNYISTKYLTAYTNGTTDKSSTSKLFEIGKVGDATKEVRATTQSTNWFNDNSVFLFCNAPYFGRGGVAGEGIYNGIFYSDSTHGQPLDIVSFRVSLGK